jgi:Domain of unknown function (DUF1929)
MATFELIPASAEILAIHAALLPTGTKGKVIIMGGDEHNDAQAGRDNSPAAPAQVDNTRIYDVNAKTISGSGSPSTDVFCSGHAFLGDGRFVIGGGTESWEGGGGPGGGHVHGLGNFGGHPACWVYNYLRNAWERIADFNFDDAFGKTGGGRWYPTLVTLPNGDLIAFSGHPSRRSDHWHNNNIPERYSQASQRWNWIKPTASEITFYPRIHLIKGGLLFICAVEDGTSRFYNPSTGDFEGPSTSSPGGTGGIYDGWNNTSVLLPLLPNENYRARILMSDGIDPLKIDLGAATPSWQTAGARTGAAAGRLRKWGISTILPDGKIVVFGGVDDSNSDATKVLEPEIYDPGINWSTGTYSNPESWQSAAADPNGIARNYHSTNLLLPDGSVLTAGSSHNANSGDPATMGEMRIVLFKPDYFDDAARPDLISAALSTSYGKQITIGTPNAANIQRVALIRNGSSTHAFNPDQRYVALTFDHLDNNTLIASVPNDPSVLPPGYYMLWIIDDAGRPCKLAKFIRVAFQNSEIITDRSTFSVLEVDAALADGDALFQRAFYVVYDGFIPSELGNFTTPPSIAFNFSGGGTVPAMSAALADIEYEDPTLPAEIPQKVTFVFDVKFTNDSAFSFTDPTRDVTIIATLGQNIAAAVINFIKAPNPYMVDGTTSWLSVDLRVFQLKQGQVKASIVQGGSGNDFIRDLLARFNILADNDYHPFKSITIDQEDSKLELSETVGGVTVFNYAIAKVRYKAPVPTLPPPDANDAKDVKVFFRLFNTAGTAMNYNPATTYRRAGTGVNTISLIGKEGGAISSLPFFAAPRINYSTASMATQTDNINKQPIKAKNNIESVAYFGCWLDINRDGNKLFPLAPADDGPFPATGKKSILELIRGVHQCLVAEVYFEGDPTPTNATPGSSDNLSQRNLAIVASDNPGNQATHTVQHTFEIKPSPFGIMPPVALNPVEDDIHLNMAFVNHNEKQKTGPDILLIHWNNLPKESKITFYTPDIKVDDILQLESFTRLSSTKIKKEDEHTCSFLAADINYIPIPGGFEKNIPGLMTVELPPTVVKGQLFKILVQQARYYRNSRRIIGSFQVNIPVTTAALMLPSEMRNLAVLKHIHNSIPITDSWYKIFNKYLKGLSDKVDGLGGDATNVPASPNDKWMDDGAQVPGKTGMPNNVDEVTGDIKDAIRCIEKHAENISCIKVKKITLDIHFKDKDCC